jgi:hypothetical protein
MATRLNSAAVARITERLGAVAKGFNGRVARAGWFASARYEDTGYGAVPVAYVALIHEKGAPAVGIVPRPTLGPTVTEFRDDWKGLAASGVRQVVRGTMDAEQVLEGIGMQMAGDISAVLARADVAPISKVTILLRKWKKEGRTINRTVVQEARAAIAAGASIAGIPADPLHDSGHMQATISHDVGDAGAGTKVSG